MYVACGNYSFETLDHFLFNCEPLKLIQWPDELIPVDSLEIAEDLVIWLLHGDSSVPERQLIGEIIRQKWILCQNIINQNSD